MPGSSGNIWDTFWTIAAAISGLGLPGAVLFLLIGYFVVFLRWICRDSSLADAWRATKPGRRLWLKMIAGTAVALFLLNLPLCALELFRYTLYVGAAVCAISVFSRPLREATRFSHWRFWGGCVAFLAAFDLLLWTYCFADGSAAGLESFFPISELVLGGLGALLYARPVRPDLKRDTPTAIAARLSLCVLTLAVIGHASVQVRYFQAIRARNGRIAAEILGSGMPVSHAMTRLLTDSPARPLGTPAEEKVSRARVDFEENLARVMAFFFGLAAFNVIFAVTSRHFGVSDAKRIPQLVPATGMGGVPEMPETVRRALFFPNRRYRRGHSSLLVFLAMAGNLLVSFLSTYTGTKGNPAHFVLSFLAYSGMLFPPIALGCRNGFRLAAYRARSSLHGVRILMHNPAYRPLAVTVRAPTLLQRAQHRITGAWVRHAVDQDGRLYSLMFGHCPGSAFPALLYQLRSGPLNESLTGRQAYVAIPQHEDAEARRLWA